MTSQLNTPKPKNNKVADVPSRINPTKINAMENESLIENFDKDKNHNAPNNPVNTPSTSITNNTLNS